jgi:hypothetical protein
MVRWKADSGCWPAVGQIQSGISAEEARCPLWVIRGTAEASLFSGVWNFPFKVEVMTEQVLVPHHAEGRDVVLGYVAEYAFGEMAKHGKIVA